MMERIMLYKTYVFALSCLLLLWIGYQLAFQKTWEAYRLHQQLTAQLSFASDVSYPPAYLERKAGHLSALLEKYTSDTLSFKSKVISAVSPLAESGHCKIVAVGSNAGSAFTTAVYQLQKVSLEGEYAPLMQVLKKIEASPQAGLVRSATWHTTELHSANRNIKRLALDIYMMGVKK